MNTGRVWLTADTHFSHEVMIDKYGRPFKNATEMDSKLIKAWNNCVAPNDTILHLGDLSIVCGDKIGFINATKMQQILNGLNGHKVLIKGNHDKKSNAWYMKVGFDNVCDAMVISNNIFTHTPVKRELMQYFKYNFHGHHHANVSERYRKSDGYVCVSVERTKYQPVLLNGLLKDLNNVVKPNHKKYISNPALYENDIEDWTEFYKEKTEG